MSLPAASLPARRLRQSARRALLAWVVTLSCSGAMGACTKRYSAPIDPASVAAAWVDLANADSLGGAGGDVARKALAVLEPASGASPGDVKLGFGAAWARELSGERDKAERGYVDVARAAGRHDEVEVEFYSRLFLGRILLARNEAARSIVELRRAVDLTSRGKKGMTDGPIPTCIGTRGAEAFVELGNAYHQTGQDDFALEAYSKAPAHRSTEWRGYYQRGLILLARGQRDEAGSEFKLALDRRPELKPEIEKALAR